MLQKIIKLLAGVLNIFRKRKPLSHVDTGVGTVFKILFPQVAFKILEIRFKTTALAAGETLSFTRIITNAGGVFGEISTFIDYLIYSNDLGTAGTTDLSVVLEGEEGIFTDQDSIVPALSANTGGDRWGLEIVYELL